MKQFSFVGHPLFFWLGKCFKRLSWGDFICKLMLLHHNLSEKKTPQDSLLRILCAKKKGDVSWMKIIFIQETSPFFLECKSLKRRALGVFFSVNFKYYKETIRASFFLQYDENLKGRRFFRGKFWYGSLPLIGRLWSTFETIFLHHFQQILAIGVCFSNL